MWNFKSMFLMVVVFSTLLLSGCGREDYEIGSTEVGYVYKGDISTSSRHETGSGYFRDFPLQDKHKLLKIDYGVFTRDFMATYTLPVSQKISIPVTAKIMIRLKKTPGSPDFNQDKLAQFYMSNISAKRLPDQFTSFIGANDVYEKLMAENEDKAFRSVFTDADTYVSFDKLESSIIEIQDRIKKALTEQAKDANIEIIGVRIQDIPVPGPIQVSRSNSLKLDQDLVNQEKELRMIAKVAAQKQAINVREAFNDVVIDMIASQTSKSYILVKAIKTAAESGSPMNVSFTPDFMDYIDKKDTSSSKTESKSLELYEKLYPMTNEELIEYFEKGQK